RGLLDARRREDHRDDHSGQRNEPQPFKVAAGLGEGELVTHNSSGVLGSPGGEARQVPGVGCRGTTAASGRCDSAGVSSCSGEHESRNEVVSRCTPSPKGALKYRRLGATPRLVPTSPRISHAWPLPTHTSVPRRSRRDGRPPPRPVATI